MRVIGLILGVIIIFVSGYSLFTGESVTIPYVQILLGILLIILGINQLKENRKALAILLFCVAAFSILINIFMLLR